VCVCVCVCVCEREREMRDKVERDGPYIIINVASLEYFYI
jgi:hypothetical protein